MNTILKKSISLILAIGLAMPFVVNANELIKLAETTGKSRLSRYLVINFGHP